VLKAKGFFDGDVEAKWGAESDTAMKKYSQTFDYPYQTYDDRQHHFFQHDIADWFLDNDSGAIRPKTVGVFFVSFNEEPHKNREQVLDILFRGKNNVKQDFARNTRGIVRLEFHRNYVHDAYIGDHTRTKQVDGIISKALGFDMKKKYDFRIFIMPSSWMGLEAFASAMGLSGGRDSYYILQNRHVFLHEIGHNLGLNHMGIEVRGNYQEYMGYVSAESNKGTSFAAIDLIWLRAIHRNVLELKESGKNLKIKSLTSISDGYKDMSPYSKFSGNVAAKYQSPDKGPEYIIEWRQQRAQDIWLEHKYIDALIVTHKRDNQWRSVIDTALKVGEKWTSPRRDFEIIHVGPVGTFSVNIRRNLYDESIPVNFFSWDKYIQRLKDYKRKEIKDSARRAHEFRVRRGLALSEEQKTDIGFLKKIEEMCKHTTDERCEEAKAILAKL
jgi:hypothetical protein